MENENTGRKGIIYKRSYMDVRDCLLVVFNGYKPNNIPLVDHKEGVSYSGIRGWMLGVAGSSKHTYFVSNTRYRIVLHQR